MKRDKWDKPSKLRELVLPDFDLREGICAQTDPEIFFPDRNNPTWHLAKRVCKGCPVQMQCLEWALRNNENFGVWGGMTPQERLRLKGRGKGSGHGPGRPKKVNIDINRERR